MDPLGPGPAVCPICGYNQGEERILVSHLMGVHGGIPHTQGEELFVCAGHPGLQPMNHLEYVKHAVELSGDMRLGVPKPNCQPVSLGQEQTVTMPLKDWQAMAASRAKTVLRPLPLRWGFSMGMSGGILMVIEGARLIPVVDVPIFQILGWAQLLAGFMVLVGSLFYANPSRVLQGASIVLISSSVGWAALFLVIATVLEGGVYVSGVLMLFLFLAPLFATAGSVRSLYWGRRLPKQSHQ